MEGEREVERTEALRNELVLKEPIVGAGGTPSVDQAEVAGRLCASPKEGREGAGEGEGESRRGGGPGRER